MATLDYAMPNPKEELAIITLDAEKAFDNVSLHWLFQTMEHMGFQGEILNFLKSMYSAPKARVHVNNHLSQQINLMKGTRQKCLLSPILFNLALEPLYRHLLDNPNLNGIKTRQN